MRRELSYAIRKLMRQAIKQGYVTYAALDEAMPADDYSSEEIEDVVAVLSSNGITIVDSHSGETTPNAADRDNNYRPGMKFYEAVWKRDGEEIFRMVMHATDETSFMEKALAHLAEYAIGDNLEGATVEIGFGESRPAPYQPEEKSIAAAADASVWQAQDQERLNGILDFLTWRPLLPTED